MTQFTEKDRALRSALGALPDRSLDLARAHLQAGFPMSVAFGWDEPDSGGGSAVCGCLVGISMSRSEYISLADVNTDYLAPRPGTRSELVRLADEVFPQWARQYVPDNTTPLPAPARARLSELLDGEHRRRYGPAEPVRERRPAAAAV